jgi:Sec-independent protein translocase protein TatA
VNLGPTEIAIVGLLALLFLGPKRTHEFFRSLGRFLAELRQQRDKLVEPLRRELDQATRIEEDIGREMKDGDA